MPAHRLLALLLVTCLLGGCYTYKPLTIEVRDVESAEPIGDAVVIVRSLNFFSPDGPGDFVHPSPSPSVWGRTDPDGVVHFEQGAACPGHIVVIASGDVPHSLLYEVHPADTGRPTDWLDANWPDDEGPVTVQVRLSP